MYFHVTLWDFQEKITRTTKLTVSTAAWKTGAQVSSEWGEKLEISLELAQESTVKGPMAVRIPSTVCHCPKFSYKIAF